MRIDGYELDEDVAFADGLWRSLRFRGPLTLLAHLPHHPLARALERLTLGLIFGEGDDALAVAARQLASADPPLAALRTLQLGTVPEGQEASAWELASAGDLSQLAISLPRLETLRLLIPQFTLGSWPSLRTLDARLGVTPASVASIASASLPALERLELGFEATDPDDPDAIYPTTCWRDDVLDELVKGHATPALRVLRLWLHPDADGAAAILDRVRASPLGQRLDRLELGGDDLADAAEDRAYSY